MDVKAARRRELGRLGEDLAAMWYEARGYEVLARNWSCRFGELDIVARKAGHTVFCEVKARSSATFGQPVEAVGPAKRARLRRLAAMWLACERASGRARRPGPRQGPWEVRFDVASVLAGSLEVIEGAF